MATAQITSAQSSAEPRPEGRVSVLEVLLIILLAALVVWKGLVPGWRLLNTDFPNYYVAARLIRMHYSLDRLYDWIWFQRIAEIFGVHHQLVGFLGLTPFSALPVIPLSWLPVLEAKRVWLLCNVALLFIAVHWLSRQCGLSYRRTWFIALCATLPLSTSLQFGQMHILVLTLMIAAFVCHMRERQIGSGCYIALAAALKVYPVFFCLYFVFKKRWRALIATVASLGLCMIASYLLVGREAMTTYLFQQLPRSLQGESGNPFLPTLTSSSALFHRLFLYEPELNPHPLVPSPMLYALAYPLWQAVLTGAILCRIRIGFRADEREALEWSGFVCLLMFLSSAPASYQFVVLIAAAVPTIAILLLQQRRSIAVIFLGLYFAACNFKTIPSGGPTTVLTPFLYLKLWSGVGLVAFYWWILVSPQAHWRAVPEKQSPSLLFRFAAAVLCLWIPGAYSAWSHLRTIRPAIPLLAGRQDPTYMSIDPAITDTGLFYIDMRQTGYRVRSTEMRLPDDDSNQLSFVASLNGRDVWVETVRDGSSRLARIVSKTQTTNCQIDNAETPALSQDGSTLAFVREEHGYGNLRTLDVARCDNLDQTAPLRITPPGLDVRTVSAGANNTFLISAVYRGRERVFTVAPGEPPRLLAETGMPLDSPSLSPDGNVLAVRELIAERWQLMSLDLSSGAWKQLTHGDCNAYTPSWKDNNRTLLYATDCLRGLGLTTLTSLEVSR
jgi:hypothetical protein